MDLGLSGKRALITGGSRGIGKATARQLIAEGARVAIVARDKERLDSTASELSSSGNKVFTYALDTRDEAAVKDMVKAVAEALGGIDILINCAAEAGGGGPAPRYNEVTRDALIEQIDVKVMGYLRVAQGVAPYMIENHWGRIVNVSGLAARTASSVIGSTRNIAVSAMSKNLADELGEFGINVTVVHPGLTVTERTSDERKAAPMDNIVGRMIEADEVASVITFIASERSVGIAGDAIACGGGQRGSIYY